MLASIERGAGHPVVLLHGQPGTGASWQPLVDRLETEFRVLAPDRPGYGRSELVACGFADNAAMIVDFLEQRDALPATVVAHSWAGAVGVLLATDFPSAVSDLVLVGAACTPDSIDIVDRLLNVPFLGDVLTVAGLVAIGEVLPRVRRLTSVAPERYRARLESALPDETVFGRARGALGRHKRSFMIEQRALLGELSSVTARLGDVDVPTAVVTGSWDLVVRPRAAATLAAAIDSSELFEIADAGHFVARDAPETLADIVRATAKRQTDLQDGA